MLPSGQEDGQILGGRYRLGKLLGTGSFGRVYEGHHTSLAQHVAIKVFRKDVVVLAGGPDRVLVEAKAASRVHHRNIVDVHDIGRFEDTVYVASELVLGGTLHALLVRAGRLPWSRAREVALQIAAALKAAHKRGVLHRGLRAANCFVLEDLRSASPELRTTAELRIKVSDFGFAHSGLAGGGRGEEHTSPFVGDAAYTAPELAQGTAASVRSDVYAFGVLLYRMLTGSLPFEGSTPYQVLEAHVTRPVPPPRDVLRSIPAEVEAIVLRALAKDPDERFETVRELELALEEVSAQVEGEPDEAAPSRALDDLVTGQHAQARPQAAPAQAAPPPPPARDEAMHAAFERRDEPGEQVPTSMFDRRLLMPYFGPTDALEAPPEPTIMLGASMFAEMRAEVRPEAAAFPQPMTGAPPEPMLGVPGASELPQQALGAFPQLMPGVRRDASALPNLATAQPEPTVMLGGGGHPFAPPEATTLLAHSLLPTTRLDGVGSGPGADPGVDGPTMHFPARDVAMAQAQWAGPGPVARPSSSAPPGPAPTGTGFVPVAPPASAYAVAHPPAPRVQAPPPPSAPMPRTPVPPHPSQPAAISAMSVVIVGVAVAIGGAIIGLALACPARAASSEPTSSSQRMRSEVANDERGHSTQEQ